MWGKDYPLCALFAKACPAYSTIDVKNAG